MHINNLFLFIITLTNGKLNLDGITPDFPVDWKTETERVQSNWDNQQKKWFDYIFDPHYDIEKYGLNDGTEIPSFGIHTANNDNLYESLVFALRLGYRYIHTSLSYNNHESIAKAMSTVGIRKSSIFLSLKIQSQYYGYIETKNAVKSFLKEIEMKNIDLCIMDGPQVIINDDNQLLYKSAEIRRLTWNALESLFEDGICMNLGVSGFGKKHIIELLQYAKWKPSVNIIEYHPYFIQKKFINYLIKERILVISEQVINPTNDNSLIKEQLIRDLARKYSKTPAQILIKWCMQQGIVVVVSDKTKQRIADNAQTLDFKLEYNDIYDINKLNKKIGFSSNNSDNIDSFNWKTAGMEEKYLQNFAKIKNKLNNDRGNRYRQYKQQQNKQEL